MGEILTRAICFIGIIALGYFLRRIGVFKKEDFQVISKIVVRVTLTAAIVINFSSSRLQYDMLLMTLIGFSFGVTLMLLGFILHRKEGREAQAFAVLNTAGCNIGNFVIPFAQSFLGPTSVMAVSLFDVGNSFICLGGAFGVASSIKTGTGGFSIRPVLRALTKSAPFITYLIMTTLCIFRLRLPEPVIEYAGIIANANAFMAMFMIGVGFQLSGERSQRKQILRVLGTRYGLGISLAVLSFLFLPFPLEYRQGLVILFLAPIASAAPAFTSEMKSDYGLSSAINSMSILISIVLIVSSLFIIL